MRCVSYTRTGGCYSSEDIRHITVQEQNRHIREYAKTHGLTIERKYSDQKRSRNNADGFELMRVDGQNRTFDMVIADTIRQCGQDVYQALRLFDDVFYPVGIHFAFVQEDFCSLDHSRDEVEEFFQNQRHIYNSYCAEVRQRNSQPRIYMETYGFRYNRDDDALEIDEDTAAVVRLIFGKLLEGMKTADIGRELTKQGIETPGSYYRRTKGWDSAKGSHVWTGGVVYHLASNPKYAGRWERVIDGKNYAEDITPIVEPAVFDEVQKIFAQRCHHKQTCTSKDNPFLKMITDEETSARITLKKNQNTGIYDYHFMPPKPAGVSYERTCIYYEDAVRQAKTLLARERQLAAAVAEYLDTEEGQRYRDTLIEAKRKNCRNMLLRSYVSPGSASGCHIELDECLAELDDLMIAYSRENPWIKLFLQYDDSHEFSGKYIRRFVEHAYVYRFENIRLDMKEREWKMRLPKEWLEDRQWQE